MRSPLLSVLLLALLATEVGAQSSGLRFARYPRTPRTLSLDLATGTLTRGATPVNRSAATVTDFSNLDLGGPQLGRGRGGGDQLRRGGVAQRLR